VDGDGRPLELRRFDPADWGGGPDAASRFYEALAAWQEAHPGSPWRDLDGPWPDVPFDASSL
jgi:hypothetical protein